MMKGYIFLVLNLAISFTSSTNTTEPDIVEIIEEKSIIDANKGYLDDDILETPNIQRSSIVDANQLWTSPVPYVLDNGLELNAKGVILRAFEQFRLKTCIDFKPRDSEEYYISFEKRDGCFSFIGRVQPNGQVLSIGRFCDTTDTTEHEILHALGFYHEQSRFDRDNFVTIVLENVLQGKEHNFRKVDSDQSTTHGVPYDYWSVMHYGKDFFTNGNGSTIITKDPKFQDVIGQRLEMSTSDVQELNLLYKCNSTISFVMHCSFSNGTMCQMSGNSWELVKQVSGGPNSDHTSLPSGNGDNGQEGGHFMHVSTALGQEGDSARLETQVMSPKRGCPVQCLQFYYYNSGNRSDVLNIWIREFQDEQDSSGTLRLMGQITGETTSHWKLQHVSLNATKRFQVVFEAQKGAGSSAGGLSIDDINLSETECPHMTLQIDDFEKLLNTSAYGTRIYSPRQYSKEGYAYRVATILFKTQFGLYFQLLSGDNDDQLEFPCLQRQMTSQMLDQNPNIQLHMTKQRSFTTDESQVTSSGISIWANPRETGSQVFTDENNQAVYGGLLFGRGNFLDMETVKSREFLKGGSAIFTFNFQDLRPVLNGSTPQCSPRTSSSTSTPPTTKEDKISSTMTTPPTTPNDTISSTTTTPPTTKVDRISSTITTPPTTPNDTTSSTTTTPPTTKEDKTSSTTSTPPTTKEDKISSTMTTPPTTPNDTISSTNTAPPTTDGSIFGFSPGMVASPLFTALLLLMLFTNGQKVVGPNAKGVILRAFDSFRVKSCMDFKLRVSEEYYISFEDVNGCFSFIGKVKPNGQVVSIGKHCENVNTVQHELLHTLGFYHEHARHDRDAHVTIVKENIMEGKESNFNVVEREESTTHGVPYDYWSTMHYGKNMFSNGNGSTIITKDPKFQDVIGQSLGMSPLDVLELNLHYKCNSTIAFMMHCSFSNGSLCQMTQCSHGGKGWEAATQVFGGPESDHTSLASAHSEHGQEGGHFIHVSTASGQEGDSARLETQVMSPKRGCPVQCLQFYYYNSGNMSDVLNIWIREFQDEQDSSGTIRLMGQITGETTSHWKLQHVSLNATKRFQVVFEAQKGAGSSAGGLSIDDINLSETECPHVTLQIDDFEKLLSTSAYGTRIYSPRQYSKEGYAYRLATILFQSYFGLYAQIVSGDNDDRLEWPCLQRQMTFQMLDQNPNIQLQMFKQKSFTTNKNQKFSDGTSHWDKPRKAGEQFVDDNHESIFAGPLLGFDRFASLKEMRYREFLKGGSAIFTLESQDITPLFNESSLPCSKVGPVKITHPQTYQDKGPCFLRIPPTVVTSHPTSNNSVLSFSPTKVASPPLTLLLLLVLLKL
ncbi:uncharacterized protein ACNS7B_019030 [Menidia menidia]